MEFCKNVDLHTYLPDEFCAALFENNGFYLFPKYVVDMVYKQDREYLKKFEEENINSMTVLDGDWVTYWYERKVSSQFISNNALCLGNIFGLTTFLISNVKRVNSNEYLVYSDKIISKDADVLRQDYKYRDLFDKESVIIKLKKDGNFLEVYVNREKTPREIYCYVNNDFRLAINQLIHENKMSNLNLIWPRHADGSCDYDDNKSTNTVVSTNKTTTTAVTNVVQNKIMTVNENLKLRSGEATTTSVLTVMSAGTKVKILQLGKVETIDGINSNWVKIEVLSGKDRDGKEIKEGTVGWCYGGYLK